MNRAYLLTAIKAKLADMQGLPLGYAKAAPRRPADPVDDALMNLDTQIQRSRAAVNRTQQTPAQARQQQQRHEQRRQFGAPATPRELEAWAREKHAQALAVARPYFPAAEARHRKEVENDRRMRALYPPGHWATAPRLHRNPGMGEDDHDFELPSPWNRRFGFPSELYGTGSDGPKWRTPWHLFREDDYDRYTAESQRALDNWRRLGAPVSERWPHLQGTKAVRKGPPRLNLKAAPSTRPALTPPATPPAGPWPLSPRNELKLNIRQSLEQQGRAPTHEAVRESMRQFRRENRPNWPRFPDVYGPTNPISGIRPDNRPAIYREWAVINEPDPFRWDPIRGQHLAPYGWAQLSYPHTMDRQSVLPEQAYEAGTRFFRGDPSRLRRAGESRKDWRRRLLEHEQHETLTATPYRYPSENPGGGWQMRVPDHPIDPNARIRKLPESFQVAPNQRRLYVDPRLPEAINPQLPPGDQMTQDQMDAMRRAYYTRYPYLVPQPGQAGYDAWYRQNMRGR